MVNAVGRGAGGDDAGAGVALVRAADAAGRAASGTEGPGDEPAERGTAVLPAVAPGGRAMPAGGRWASLRGVAGGRAELGATRVR